MTFELDFWTEYQLMRMGLHYPGADKDAAAARMSATKPRTKPQYYLCHECRGGPFPKKFKTEGAYHRHVRMEH